ncbi:hypothetical protein ASPFODRAFT_148458 [Aspergillus luchuensis CBS 106.47]|uniref:Lipase-like C-terminal domain-containing protein n=1 Tax=Aspergillus luchuensis (strain CBS 106.47) TaxID=1137211 RepID=A0A1M3SZL5_ASPLC|nr:hypothetical protein ASPFODRAFT_148458 [Aspergillus luchuensis CBS 106.47]
MAPLNNVDGLVNLRNLVQEVNGTSPADKSVPIVFVPGFSGWGAPLFGAINYFGGVINIPKLLVDEGYTVIVAPVAPISTNWERACELYRQLTVGRFSTVDPTTSLIKEVYDIDVNYGSYFAADPAHAPEDNPSTGRRRAILFPNSQFPNDWKWDRSNKVHFICHSQGGNTVRYLISLMANGSATWHPEYFGDGEDERDDWIVSVTTLGTPHRGTTIINALDRFISRSRQQAVSLVARLFAAASFYPAEKRAYDLQLDHWGIRRKAGETFQDMLLRLESVDGPVWKWLTSNHNGFYDNSIEGVHDLSQKAINTSGKVYYFSLSFHATVPFPEDWPTWGLDAIDSFPTRLEDFVRGATRNIPIVPWVVDGLIGIITGAGWSFLTTVTSFRSFVEWVTDAVITRISRELGYDLVFPKPGRYIPRKDVIPIMLLSVYAMGGQDLTQVQKNILGVNQEDWYQNDGVVNTESMRGPLNSARGISSLPDFDFSIPGKKGIYWHLGDNDQMDHADEIGVFIEQNTVRLRIPCR